MHRTQTLLTLTLAVAMIGSSCARRVEVPALPPEIPAVIETISKDTTLSPEQKAELIKDAIDATERIYQRILDRYESQGQNVKETALQLLTVAASVAALVWGVK